MPPSYFTHIVGILARIAESDHSGTLDTVVEKCVHIAETNHIPLSIAIGLTFR